MRGSTPYPPLRWTGATQKGRGQVKQDVWLLHRSFKLFACSSELDDAQVPVIQNLYASKVCMYRSSNM